MGAIRIAIGAGKGGVGKSFVTANLGITLAKLGKRVCLVDFDLTSANLHTSLGQEPSAKNLSRYFFDSAPLKDQIVQTLVPQVFMIQGFWDQWSPVQVSPSQTAQLLQDLAGLNFDFVLLDLGPGAMEAYLQAFSKCEERILITSPEPTSLEKTYRFLEAHVWDRLKQVIPEREYPRALQAFFQYREQSLKTQTTAIQFLQEKLSNPGISSTIFVDSPNQSPVRLLINECRNDSDRNLSWSLRSVSSKFFGLTMTELGTLDFDNGVWQAIRSREAFLISKPFSPVSAQLLGVAKTLTSQDLHAQILRAAV